jgi:hypothetical protein
MRILMAKMKVRTFFGFFKQCFFVFDTEISKVS